MATRKKRRIRLGRLITVVVLVLLLAGTGIYAAYRLAGPRDAAVKSAWTESAIKPGTELLPFQDGLLYRQEKELIYTDVYGEERWSLPMSSDRVQLAASAQNIAVFTPQLLEVLDGDSKVKLTYELEKGNMSAIAMSGQYIAIRIAQDEGETVQVIDFSGKVVDEETFTEQTVVNFGLTADELLWVLTLDVTSGSPVSRLALYQPGQSMKCAYSMPDQLVYDAAFTKDRILAMGNSYCMWYNYVGDQLGETLVYGWRLAAQSGNDSASYMALLPDSLSEDDTALPYARILKDGELTQAPRLPVDLIGVGLTGQYMVQIQPRKITLTSLAGKRDREITLPADIQDGLVVNQGKGLLLETEKKCYYLPLS